MSVLQRFFSSIFPGRPAPPAPTPRPNLLAVEGQLIDLNQLSTAELATLEAHLLARRQQRQHQLLGHLHELAAERARLLASSDPTVWLMTLRMLFGDALGLRVATQDIGPGMQLLHLVLSRGQPDHVEASATGMTLVYGDRLTGSYYDLEGDVITRAVGPPLAP